MEGRYKDVFIDNIKYNIPPRIVETSKLAKLALRALKFAGFVFPEESLYGYTGIGERRVWPKNIELVKICQDLAKESIANKNVMEYLSFRYCSLTKHFIEPATIAEIMSGLNLPKEAEGYDISDACLGIADGLISVADDIGLERTKRGLVLGFEDSRRLIINTLQYLKAYYIEKKDKINFREMIASLTLGSSSVAISLNRGSGICKLEAFLGQSDTKKSDLCVGRFEGDKLLMRTNAPALQESGIYLVKDTVHKAMDYFKWKRANVVITHQVGKSHQAAVERELSGIADICNFVTYPELGNMGGNSIAITTAMAIEKGVIKSGDKVLLIPFASGLKAKPIALQF